MRHFGNNKPTTLAHLIAELAEPPTNFEATGRALLAVPAGCLPDGYDTAASFHCRDVPVTWLLDQDLLAYHAPDERWLMARSRQFGLPVAIVPASAAYRAMGVERQLAFQVGLLLALTSSGARCSAVRYRAWQQAVQRRIERGSLVAKASAAA